MPRKPPTWSILRESDVARHLTLDKMESCIDSHVAGCCVSGRAGGSLSAGGAGGLLERLDSGSAGGFLDRASAGKAGGFWRTGSGGIWQRVARSGMIRKEVVQQDGRGQPTVKQRLERRFEAPKHLTAMRVVRPPMTDLCDQIKKRCEFLMTRSYL